MLGSGSGWRLGLKSDWGVGLISGRGSSIGLDSEVGGQVESRAEVSLEAADSRRAVDMNLKGI